MYQEFFEFREMPFHITPNPRFLYLSPTHYEALQHLRYGIEERKGFIVVTGEVGCGKTTLCRSLLNELEEAEDYETALILNPRITESELLTMLLHELGEETRANENKNDLLNQVNRVLLDRIARNKEIILIIDEAQNLSVRQLEQVRLLSNLETEKQKLLQIILVGQPELMDKLKLQSLRQLNQRIAVRYHILPLSEQDIGEYIHHRLRTAGIPDGREEAMFTNDAVETIYTFSKGTPRMINVLCDRAMLAAFTAEQTPIDRPLIVQAAREVC
jgi:general secretion pathway protein A